MSQENQSQEATQKTQPRIEFVIPDQQSGIFTTYANNVQIGWTHFDVRFVFGEVVDNTPEKVVVEQRAHITVSYLQAKIVLAMLAQAIHNHESVFGEIKFPPGTMDTTVTATEATLK